MKNQDCPENAIAIIGLSGKFPGADSIQSFWDQLCLGKELITSFSDAQIHPSNYVKARGVLANIDLFDAEFFGISAAEAQITDPQHRLFLECAWEAFEDAGYQPDNYPGSVGVYGGMSLSSYFLHHIYPNQQLKDQVNEYLIRVGNDKDFLTTKVSYKLNLKGPSLAIQTACSTSLVAVCIACNHLLTYQCDMALAGGVSISLPQHGYIYEEGLIYSPDGHCKPFDAAASGTVPGNGVGIVLLKRLEDAVKDRDHVYATIRGFGINNDGHDKLGFSAPSVQGQAKVIEEALAMAEINPETISFMEAHGTGTIIGDPIEIEALKEAYQRHTDKKSYCPIGSVKSNIGHLSEAAGVAGLIKAALGLHHRLVPPHLHYLNPNPLIDFDNSPFYVNTTLLKLADRAIPHRSSVSSFGIGSTNAHLVLEEAPKQVSPSTDLRSFELLPFSARTKSALEIMMANFKQFLEENPTMSLSDAAYTLQVGRKKFDHRGFLIYNNKKEVVEEEGSSAHEEIKLLYDLGSLWVAGGAVDWIQLNKNYPGRRISLPTYPFEKKRHWIDPIKQKESSFSHSTETSLLEIFRDYLGVSSITVNDHFFELGGDSIMAIQIVSKINEVFGSSLKWQTIVENPTVALLTKVINQKKNNLLVKLKAGNDDNSLFVVHPIGGHVFCYQPLVETLNYPGSIYGIVADEEMHDQTIEKMAERYIQAIRSIQPKGPYSLLGASFGGAIVYEMASQLIDLGQSLKLICLLDIIRPDALSEGDMIPKLISLFEGKSIPHEELKSLSVEDQTTRLMESMGLQSLPFKERDKVFRMVNHQWKALVAYKPKPIRERIVFFQAKDRAPDFKSISLASTWSELVGGKVDVHEVLGNHLSMILHPHVKEISAILNTYL